MLGRLPWLEGSSVTEIEEHGGEAAAEQNIEVPAAEQNLTVRSPALQRSTISP
jgi:hypothetical protein